MTLLKKLLAQFGVEEGRFRYDSASASEGERFASIVDELTATVKKLGPFAPTANAVK